MLVQAVRELDGVAYDELVSSSQDDSVLETFDRLQVGTADG